HTPAPTAPSTLSLHDALPIFAVLQQESKAKKILIAEPKENKRLRPFITHGYSPDESADLVAKFEAARDKGDEKLFLRSRDLMVRSEEHTSELQSRGHLVCRLL